MLDENKSKSFAELFTARLDNAAWQRRKMKLHLDLDLPMYHVKEALIIILDCGKRQEDRLATFYQDDHHEMMISKCFYSFNTYRRTVRLCKSHPEKNDMLQDGLRGFP